MLLDSIYENLIASAEPALTKQRLALYVIFLIFISPDIDKIFDPLFINLPIIDALNKVLEVLKSLTLLIYAYIGLIVFFFVPYIHFFISTWLSKTHINKSLKLIEVNEALSRKNNSEIREMISERYDEFRLNAEKSTSNINSLIRNAEALSISTVIYFYASIYHHFFHYTLSIAIVILAFLLLRKAQQLIVIEYLKFVLPYKILTDRYSSAFDESTAPKS